MLAASAARVPLSSLSYVIGGHAYRAKMLEDGFWLVVHPAGDQSLVEMRAEDLGGHPLRKCSEFF